MARVRISQKQKTSIRKGSKNTARIEDFEGVEQFSPTQELLDPAFIGATIIECLQDNDPEGVMEVIEVYLETLNKSKLSKKGNLSRATLYHSLKNKNPTIKTLAKIMHASTH